eukprot:CAMPEP_0172647208 /NCGR_PEP_ID=MMETSP1068-20121228/240622_1 /TAXON_ID=35684 /ORGANISM="Pseudopedinella elastica, Strain CCMP716" /LENGTH=308 /DNA_ID=CAMNT_0013461481 /DNA_START=1374 /DNA_END=2301 /DNA_ORIENTATION=+
MGRYCLLVWTLLADEAISFGAHTKKSRISLTPRRSWLDNLEAWEAGQHDKHDVLHGSLEDEITINSLLYKRGVDVSQIPVFSSGHEALDHEAFVFSSRPTRLKARFGQTLLAESPVGGERRRRNNPDFAGVQCFFFGPRSFGSRSFCFFFPTYEVKSQVWPNFACGEVQLEENEGDETTLTSLVFKDDGRVIHTRTDGPPPSSFAGGWSSDGQKFYMVLNRKFEIDPEAHRVVSHVSDNVSGSYEVTRIFEGEFDHLGSYVTASGKAEIEYKGEEFPCGFFQIIVVDPDVDQPRSNLETTIKHSAFSP